MAGLHAARPSVLDECLTAGGAGGCVTAAAAAVAVGLRTGGDGGVMEVRPGPADAQRRPSGSCDPALRHRCLQTNHSEPIARLRS